MANWLKQKQVQDARRMLEYHGIKHAGLSDFEAYCEAQDIAIAEQRSMAALYLSKSEEKA